MAEKRDTRENNRSDAKPTLPERLCRSLDIQPDIFPYGTLIELRGRCSVTLRGCGHITEYTDTRICFSVKGGQICICGRRLSCAAYCAGSAVVDGHIDSVSFEEDEK